MKIGSTESLSRHYRTIRKSWVIVQFVSDGENYRKGQIKIWRDYDGYAWGSPIYKVLGYADSIKEAKKIKADGVEIE